MAGKPDCSREEKREDPTTHSTNLGDFPLATPADSKPASGPVSQQVSRLAWTCWTSEDALLKLLSGGLCASAPPPHPHALGFSFQPQALSHGCVLWPVLGGWS